MSKEMGRPTKRRDAISGKKLDDRKSIPKEFGFL